VSSHVIRLPWTKPPLSLNDRSDWRARARAVKDVRRVAAAYVRAAHIARTDRIRVVLTYHPRDARRRDSDNLTATLKAVCDGIVDAGVVTDDTPELMVKDMPVIAAPMPRDPHLTLTITILDAEVPA